MARIGELIGPNQEVIHPKTSADLVYLEDGRTVEQALVDNIDHGNVVFEDLSYSFDGDMEDDEVKTMIIKGKTYQNILPNPTLRNQMTNGKSNQNLAEGFEDVVVADGDFCSVMMIGETLVNILPEPSVRNSLTNGNRIQKANDVDEGAIKTVNGKVKGALVTGRTLLNLLSSKEASIALEGGPMVKDEEGYYIIDASEKYNGSAGYYQIKINYPYKVDTEYTLMCFVKENTLNEDFIDYGLAKFPIGEGVTGTFVRAFNLNYSGETLFRASISPDKTGRIKIGFLLLEGCYNDIELPYFEGIKSVEMPTVKTSGKNLFSCRDYDLVTSGDSYVTYESSMRSGSFELTCTKGSINRQSAVSILTGQHFVYSHLNDTYNKELVPKDPIMFKGGTYTLSFEPSVVNLDGQWHDYSVLLVDAGGMVIKRFSRIDFQNSTSSYTVTPSEDVHDIRVYISYGSSWLFKLNLRKIQLELNSVATTFESCKSNTMACNERVTLREINGAKDTFDLTTGEYTQVVGEVTLNGSETWSNYFISEDTISFISGMYSDAINKQHDASNLRCDKLKANGYGAWQIPYNITLNTKSFSICLPNTVVSNINEFKNWLSQNPITVQYPLVAPISKVVDVSITNQKDQAINSLNAFENGYIQLLSGRNELFPDMTYEVPTKNSYHVDMLKANTEYTMKRFNGSLIIDGQSYEGSENGTLTSPSALTDKLIVLSDPSGDEMLLEGDLTNKNTHYFEGMNSAKTPTLIIHNTPMPFGKAGRK